jgi:hypothetical protein
MYPTHSADDGMATLPRLSYLHLNTRESMRDEAGVLLELFRTLKTWAARKYFSVDER